MRRLKSALTLIELVVVLLVLVALAGVLVPQFQNFSTRAHGAAGADNAVEISKAITLFEATKLRQPNNLNSLTGDGTTALATSLGTPNHFAIQDAGTGGGNAAYANRASNLSNAGITTLSNINNAADNATFGAETGVQTTAGAAVNIAFLNAAGAAALGLSSDPDGDGDATNDYVALGVGETCEMIGSTMVDAPIHFPEGADGQPSLTYARWVAIYKVSGDTDGKAVLVSVAGLDDGDLAGANKHLEEYFESTE
ncbi:MAG: hypothetical protein P1V97_39285 [Planctomycetota bacterium]|nr:hypothetical protein [Planctomycetota bacterium]